MAMALFLLVAITSSPTRAAHAPLTRRLISASTTSLAVDDVIGVHLVAIGPPEERLGIFACSCHGQEQRITAPDHQR